MFATLTIEGSEFKTRIVPRKTVISIWKMLTEKPFPRVMVFQLKDNDFDLAIELMRCRDDQIREIQEWGGVLSTEGTDACVFNDDESADFDYVVLIREDPFHSLGEILRHELVHIVRGDL